jgi:hypothetical protein
MDNHSRVTLFFQYFTDNNLQALEQQMSPEAQSYITRQDGGVFQLTTCKAFIENIQNMHIERVDELCLQPTQIAVINKNSLLAMVEIKAKLKDHQLHNFSAFLITFEHDLIVEIRMVEALPEQSAKFWQRTADKIG